MKDSKEKEQRISNLKDMIKNINEIDSPESNDFEEDTELIDYLNEDRVDYDGLEIDDEFIYRPSDEPSDVVNLEEGSIDEDFLIRTPREKDFENENGKKDELGEDLVGDISENFDSMFHAKIGRTPVVALISAFIGLILIVVAAFIFQSRSDRVIDHVVSGETNFIFVIVLALGLVFFVYGIYKIFNLRNPLKGISDSIDSIDSDKEKETDNTTAKNEPSPEAIADSEIPLDKDSYKIGEFGFDDLKNKLKKPTTSQKEIQENLDDIPPAKEKEDYKKGLTSEEIEEIEYNKVVLESESIDDIFKEVEDIDDMPIISNDSKEKN